MKKFFTFVLCLSVLAAACSKTPGSSSSDKKFEPSIYFPDSITFVPPTMDDSDGKITGEIEPITEFQDDPDWGMDVTVSFVPEHSPSESTRSNGLYASFVYQKDLDSLDRTIQVFMNSNDASDPYYNGSYEYLTFDGSFDIDSPDHTAHAWGVDLEGFCYKQEVTHKTHNLRDKFYEVYYYLGPNKNPSMNKLQQIGYRILQKDGSIKYDGQSCKVNQHTLPTIQLDNIVA